MVLAQFSLSGPLIDAVSETAYDLNGDTHLYDFLVMRVDEAASADPARFAWPRAAQTVRMLFDGTPPAMGIHIGDTLRLTGPVTTIFTNRLNSVPPLRQSLKSETRRMISDARRWQKLTAGAQGTAFGRLTAQFEAERLPFDQWLQKQTALFGAQHPTGSVAHAIHASGAGVCATGDQRPQARPAPASPGPPQPARHGDPAGLLRDPQNIRGLRGRGPAVSELGITPQKDAGSDFPNQRLFVVLYANSLTCSAA
jgi:hypothetical protein